MTAAIASESLGNLNTLNLNLQSLSGVTFDQLKEATEACGGSVVAVDEVESVELQESLDPPLVSKKRGRKKREDFSDAAADSSSVEPTIDPEEQKPIEPHSSQPRSGAALLLFQKRFEAFGFYIPLTTINSWMPQSVRQLEKTVFSWEEDTRLCDNWTPVCDSIRQSIPPLIASFEKPTEDQTNKAWHEGEVAGLAGNKNFSINLYPLGSMLSLAWAEGLKSGMKPDIEVKEPQKSIEQKPWIDPQLTTKRDAACSTAPAPTAASAPIAQSSSRSTLAAYEAGRSSARQEAIDRILSELFAENSTIKSLAEEIKDLKTNLKELNETREEHVVKSNRLMDELEKVSKGEFQEGLPFGE